MQTAWSFCWKIIGKQKIQMKRRKKCMFSRVNHMSYGMIMQEIYDFLRLQNNENRWKLVHTNPFLFE